MASNSTLESVVAAALTGFTAGPSLLLTVLCGYALFKRGVFRNKQYAWLTASLAVADGGILAVFFFWTVPVTLFGQKDAHSLIGRKMGQLALTCQYSVLYNMFLIAVNRYTAVVHYQKCQMWFSSRNTKALIILVWIISLCNGLLYFVPGCDFVYDHTIYVWLFVESKCFGLMIALDLWYSLFFLIIIFILNFVAGCALLKSNRNLSKNQNQRSEEKKRRKQEARFFLQTCLNVAVFAFMFVCFHQISPHASTTIEVYATTSWIWQASHAANAWILVIFNRDMRQHVLAIGTCSPINHQRIQPTSENTATAHGRSKTNKETTF